MNILDEHRRLKRVFIFAIAMIVILFVLLFRLFYLQVIEGDQYQNLAEKNRISVRLTPPIRGEILDGKGHKISSNKTDYRLVLIPRDVKNLQESLKALSLVIALSPNDQQRITQNFQKFGKRSTSPILLQNHLTLDEIFKLELANIENVGAYVYETASRVYPLKEAGVHILGYIGAISQKDQDHQNLSKLGNVLVGKTGLEKIHEEHLFGKPGIEEIEINATGQLIRMLSREESQTGNPLETTLDGDLQTFIYALLEPHKSAAVIVMDVETGAVLSLVSYPGFDPHFFEDGISTEDWKDLLNDTYKPLINKAVSGLYAPGSAFKMIVALAALETGIDPEERHFCSGELILGNHPFHCHKAHGSMNMNTAIRESCDIFFYEIAQKIGIERIASMAQKFGFGQKTALDFHSEQKGLMPNKSWKESVKKESWKVFDTINSSIGQGYVLATPLQLAQMTARLATGKEVVPHIIKQLPIPFPDLEVSKKHLNLIQEAMKDVINHPLGSGFASRLESVFVSGKTGTSQVKRISLKDRLSGAYRSVESAWADKDHAVFVGFAPSDAPKYAVVVVVEHGGWGSRTAAPIAREIFKKLFS